MPSSGDLGVAGPGGFEGPLAAEVSPGGPPSARSLRAGRLALLAPGARARSPRFPQLQLLLAEVLAPGRLSCS